jgi:hypothetical protein
MPQETERQTDARDRLTPLYYRTMIDESERSWLPGVPEG